MTVSDRDQSADVKDACRAAVDQLIEKVRVVQAAYWEASALHPDQVVILGSTNLIAAMIVGGQVDSHDRESIRRFLTSWTFDRGTGELRCISLRARMLAVEDPELKGWDYRIMVPTVADMVGRPCAERGTVTAAAVIADQALKK